MLTPLWKQKIGTARYRSPKLPPLPPLVKLSWQIAAVGKLQLLALLVFIDWRGNDNVVLCVISRENRGSLGEPKANRSFLFYSSIIKPVITPILDLLFLEKSNTPIRINISLKILFHYRLGYWTCFF